MALKNVEGKDEYYNEVRKGRRKMKEKKIRLEMGENH